MRMGGVIALGWLGILGACAASIQGQGQGQAHAHGVRAAAEVAVGTDRVLEPEFLSALQGKRLGVLSHSASRNRAGLHVVDLLFARSDLRLKMIFAPEHGFRSIEDSILPDTTDTVTGLPLYSLYGPRLAPSPAMLSQLDAVLIDLQDVGVRYYTYAATMVFTMRACAQAGKPVFILDRPNPIGGAVVEGSVLEAALVGGGLTDLAPIPTRHGMTLGELARLFNRTLGIHADLTVVPMAGWERAMRWEAVALDWRPPSPALTTSEQAFLYGFLGPLEALNLSVGRGQRNDEAFRIFGAPWITEGGATRLARALSALNLPGLSFEPVAWTPTRSIYQGQLCRGFRVRDVAPDQVQTLRTQIRVLQTLWAMFKPGGSEPGGQLRDVGLDTMLGSSWLLAGIKAGESADSLLERSSAEVRAFLPLRAEALLYPR